jgi:hypothetical protein
MGGIFFPTDPAYKGQDGQPAPQPVQGFIRQLLNGFGLFSPPAPVYKTSPPKGTSPPPLLPPPATSTPPGSITVSAEIECPAIAKEGEERAGRAIEIPWPAGATRYRICAFSPVYSGHDDDRKEPTERKHRLNAAPVGINIPARGELDNSAAAPLNLVVVPTWQCIAGSVKEGNLHAVLSVVFEAPSNLPKGSN